MINFMKVNLKKVLRVDKVNILGKMEAFIEVNFKKIWETVKDIINLLKDNIKVFGKMIKDLEMVI